MTLASAARSTAGSTSVLGMQLNARSPKRIPMVGRLSPARVPKSSALSRIARESDRTDKAARRYSGLTSGIGSPALSLSTNDSRSRSMFLQMPADLPDGGQAPRGQATSDNRDHSEIRPRPALRDQRPHIILYFERNDIRHLRQYIWKARPTRRLRGIADSSGITPSIDRVLLITVISMNICYRQVVAGTAA